MPTTNEITDYLTQISASEYSDLLAAVDERRREHEAQTNPRPTEPNRDAVAQWLAKRHLATDPGITEVYYLQSAPENEIWFVEVGRLNVPAFEPLSAVDFGMDVEGVRYLLFIVDASANQLEQIRAGHLHLPRGLPFMPNQQFGRRAAA
jgi:hypothetical protein